jgi:8-oxo-dGTP pyrophosphatase MutT (NUDIX family)
MTEQVTGLEDRLRANSDWLGASCVARWRDNGFLFAGRVEGARLVLSGIGGKVEPGETFQAAMRREFREETGCVLGPVLTPSSRRLTVRMYERVLPARSDPAPD